MSMRRIAYSDLGLLQRDEVVHYDKATDKWTLNKPCLETLYSAMQKAGADCQRILHEGVYEAHPYKMRSQLAPYTLVPAPSSPYGEAFQLLTFNTYYFPIVKDLIGIAKKYGIQTIFCLANGCEYSGGYRVWSPWYTNVNGIRSIYDKKAWPIFKVFVARSIKELGPYNVIFSWGNEMNNAGFPDLAQAAIFPFIKNGIMLPKNCTYGATAKTAQYVNGEYLDTNCVQDTMKATVEDVFGLPAKLAIWREAHGVGDTGWPKVPNLLDQVLTWWGDHANFHVIVSDDGTYGGLSLCDYAFYSGKKKTRPSAQQWAAMVKTAKAYKCHLIFEHTPKNTSNLACQVGTIREMHKALYGHYKS